MTTSVWLKKDPKWDFFADREFPALLVVWAYQQKQSFFGRGEFFSRVSAGGGQVGVLFAFWVCFCAFWVCFCACWVRARAFGGVFVWLPRELGGGGASSCFSSNHTNTGNSRSAFSSAVSTLARKWLATARRFESLRASAASARVTVHALRPAGRRALLGVRARRPAREPRL